MRDRHSIIDDEAHRQVKQQEQDGIQKIYPSSLAYQFERNGYFALDKASDESSLVFNRVVTLRDTWGVKNDSKKNKQQEGARKNTNEEIKCPNNDPILLNAVSAMHPINVSRLIVVL